MDLFTKDTPKNNAELKGSIYSGKIFKYSATKTSRHLVDEVLIRLKDVLNGDIQKIHDRMPWQEFTERTEDIRQDLLKDIVYHGFIADLLVENGFDLADTVYDPPRLRCSFDGGHTSSGAKRAYSLHRDTWYGNPESQVNWWIPLHDIVPEHSFYFYPHYFDQPLGNMSKDFSYQSWGGADGFQYHQRKGMEIWPESTENPKGQGLPFTCKAGELILFSAAHLHGTCPNTSGLTRFSLDFRTVSLADHNAGCGAPNVDNASAPEALADYKILRKEERDGDVLLG